MVIIENRSVMKSDTSPIISLPKGHKIANGESLNMIVGEFVIILAPENMKIADVKQQTLTLVNEM